MDETLIKRALRHIEGMQRVLSAAHDWLDNISPEDAERHFLIWQEAPDHVTAEGWGCEAINQVRGREAVEVDAAFDAYDAAETALMNAVNALVVRQRRKPTPEGLRVLKRLSKAGLGTNFDARIQRGLRELGE